jgi:hypothetical protein
MGKASEHYAVVAHCRHAKLGVHSESSRWYVDRASPSAPRSPAATSIGATTILTRGELQRLNPLPHVDPPLADFSGGATVGNAGYRQAMASKLMAFTRSASDADPAALYAAV